MNSLRPMRCGRAILTSSAGHALPTGERRLWLLTLGPLLWLQGRHVRRVTPRLPEPPGPRQGATGQGPPLRLLIAGDSAAAGVGAPSQDQALCGHLVDCLSRGHTVAWRLLATNGLDTPGLISLLRNHPAQKYDVVVLSVGVNDVTSLCPPEKWARQQDELATLIDARFSPSLLIHSALPPMHRFTALPQPLRWFMGRWAKEMNCQLAASLPGGRARRRMHPPFLVADQVSDGLASDGFHPGPAGYATWAEGLCLFILDALQETATTE